MITFVERGEEKVWDESPYTGGHWIIPIDMIKDGKEYFVINRLDPESKISADHRDSILKNLKETDGRWTRFNSMFETPWEYLDMVARHKYTFTLKKIAFGDFEKNGFIDIHGNLREVSAAFKYRIYDHELFCELEKVIELIYKGDYCEAKEIISKTGEKKC